MEKAESNFFNLNWQEPRKILKCFFIIFIILIFIILLPFIFFGRSFLNIDFLTQHLPFAENIRNNFQAYITGNLYSFNLGLGDDILTAFTYYGMFDPFLIILFLFPVKYIEYSYMLVCILKFIGCGLTFLYFCKTIKMKPYSAICSSILYAFCGFIVLTNLRHPVFITSPFLLPLLLASIEVLLEKGKCKMLIFIIFINAIANFYLFFANAICMIIYFMVRYYFIEKKYFTKNFFNKLFHLAFLALMGILLGSFVLLPNIYTLLNGERIAGKGFMLYDVSYYFNVLTGLIFPSIAKQYTVYIGNFLIILFIPFIFSIKEKKYFIVLNIIFFTMLLIPIFGYAFNLFSYVNNRWNYLISFFIAVNGGLILDNLDNINEKHIKQGLRVFFGYIIFIAFFAVIYGLLILFNPSIKLAEVEINRKTLKSIAIIIIIICTLLLLILIMSIKKEKIIITKIKPLLTKKRLSIAFVTISILQGLMLYSFTLNDFLKIGSYQKIKDSEADSYFNKLDNGFYRVSKRTNSFNKLAFSNDNLIYEYHGNSYYNTMGNGAIIRLLQYTNCLSDMSSVGYAGFDQRTTLDTLASVKYYALREEESHYLPYGYTYKESYDVLKYPNDPLVADKEKSSELDSGLTTKMNIYENNNFLPLGYIYENYILSSDIGNLNHLKKQNIMLQGAIINTELNLLPKLQPEFYDTDIIYTSDYNEGEEVVIEKDVRFTISLTIEEEIINSELYIEYNIEKGSKQEYFIDHKINSITKRYTQREFGTLFYEDDNHPLINLGYFALLPAGSKIIMEINAPSATFAFNDFKISSNSMSNYQQKIDELKTKCIENLTFDGDNNIKGDITLPNAGIATFSIPFSNGWKAYVDGIQTDIYEVNHGYLGFVINDGYHKIQLKYQTPLLKEGLYLSSFALIIITSYFVAMYIYEKKKKSNLLIK